MFLYSRVAEGIARAPDGKLLPPPDDPVNQYIQGEYFKSPKTGRQLRQSDNQLQHGCTSYGRVFDSYNRVVTSYSCALTSYGRVLDSYDRVVTSYSCALTSYGRVLDSYDRVVTSYSCALTSYGRVLDSYDRVAIRCS